MKSLLLLTTILASIFATAAAQDQHNDEHNSNNDPIVQNYPSLVNWFTSHGGILSLIITDYFYVN